MINYGRVDPLSKPFKWMASAIILMFLAGCSTSTPALVPVPCPLPQKPVLTRCLSPTTLQPQNKGVEAEWSASQWDAWYKSVLIAKSIDSVSLDQCAAQVQAAIDYVVHVPESCE